MSGPDQGVELRVSRIAVDRYNPFNATAEELLVLALDESGLLGPETTVNGTDAEDYRRSFYRKRSHYQEMTRLGTLLVRRGILGEENLHRALALQKGRANMKLGDALLELGICSVEDIERNLDTQIQVRKDMEDIETFRRRIDSIKERLRDFF